MPFAATWMDVEIITLIEDKESSFSFHLFRAMAMAYGGSQARGQIGAIATGLHQIQAMPATYTTVQGNTRSFTH